MESGGSKDGRSRGSKKNSKSSLAETNVNGESSQPNSSLRKKRGTKGKRPKDAKASPPQNARDDEGATGFGPVEEQREREDHFGFIHTGDEDTTHYEPKLSGKTVREREEKWLAMFQKWDKFIENKAKRNKLKERCRKGIPPSLRGRAWLILTGANQQLNQNRGLFERLTRRSDTAIVTNVIDKDLDRTFPSHVLFAHKGSQGQKDLRLVLKAYSHYDEKTGYCQAMAPVAATLLMHMQAEEAFWCLVQICETYLPGYYSPGLHAFQIDALILKDLMAKHIPAIKSFMDSKQPGTPDALKGLDPILYCTEWFMSIFCRSLPWPTVLRVWDMFFFEGVKVLFKVALALLRLSFQSPESQAECAGFFELTQKLRKLPTNITHEEVLIPEVLRFHLTDIQLRKEHIQQADQHFSAERARAMELQAKRLFGRNTFSVTSELSHLDSSQ